ncbi:MAG: hypothetical protein ACW99A_13345 [Candidatus Kariarchaeaceae archaeon]|jgi:hypothetical protein
MPVRSGSDRKGKYYQWGSKGKKYYYTGKNKKAAYNKALAQGKAAYSNNYKG